MLAACSKKRTQVLLTKYVNAVNSPRNLRAKKSH